MEPFLVFLRDQISLTFSKSELKNICLELNLDWEEVETDSKSVTITNMLQYLGRRSRLDSLVTICRKERPAVPWEYPPTKKHITNPVPHLPADIEINKPLFFDLIEEVEKYPVGRTTMGYLLKRIEQVTSGEIAKEDFANHVISLLNNGDVTFSVAKQFLTIIGYDIRMDGKGFTLGSIKE